MNERTPFVVCLTNTVAANFTANVLLAIGARPAMVDEPAEAAELAAAADAVLVNVGTLTCAQAENMRAAVKACRARSVPWVLDPVAVQALSFRRRFVSELLAQKPTAIRGNREEIDFLLKPVDLQSQPVDLLSQPVDLQSQPVDLQFEICNLKSILSLATGETDLIRRGTTELARITGGVPLLQSVTATGCAQGAIVAAFLGKGLAPVEALVSASRLMKRAGERAWLRAKAPGSFQVALLDALWELSQAGAEGRETRDERRERGEGARREKT